MGTAHRDMPNLVRTAAPAIRPGDDYFFLAAPGAAAFLRWAPYLERACLRSATPWQSSTPRTM